MKKLVFVLAVLFVVSYVNAETTPFETASIGRITGNSPEELKIRLEQNEVFIEDAFTI